MAYKEKYWYLNDEEELRRAIEEHKGNGSISDEKEADKPQIILSFNRAENELKHAETMFKISESNKLKPELDLLDEDTFYSGVISHAYYSIFFGAKALLMNVKI